MYFQVKSTLKSNHNLTAKHPLRSQGCQGQFNR
jgi:hypothetical protein